MDDEERKNILENKEKFKEYYKKATEFELFVRKFIQSLYIVNKYSIEP